MTNPLTQLLADTESLSSFSSQLRQKRFAFFQSLLQSVPLPLKILDVGGRSTTWERAGLVSDRGMGVEITLINPEGGQSQFQNLRCLDGDARHMPQFADQEFDIVFSNSVIEHVGDFAQQRRMAQEIQRVGKRYFVQTPNRYFPIEPHFLFPGFQFLPLSLKVLLIQNFNLGWRPKTPDREAAVQMVESVQLMGKADLQRLFPKAKIYSETLLGFRKSLIAYGGWEQPEGLSPNPLVTTTRAQR
jgi:hypothetical protein